MRERHAPREPGISRLTRMVVRENGEPLVDLRTECPQIVMAARLPFARVTVARMLNRAADHLPEGMRLRVHTALRTTQMQSRGYWEHYRSLQEKHPTWPKSILRREANKFWHPPDVPKAPPGHCTGGAVDVNLLDLEGNAVDVTSVTREGADAQPTYALHLIPEAKANREILIAAMTQAGFSNCYDEWWHWSYGDCACAVRLGLPDAIYGWVEEYPEAVLREIGTMEAEREREEAEAKEREAAESPASDSVEIQLTGIGSQESTGPV